MKTADVVVGQIYDTRIGGERIRVRVLAEVKDVKRSYRFFGDTAERIVTKFRVARVGEENKPLPKLRSGAALGEL